MKKISQREARLLQKRVVELEALENKRRHQWNSEYPGGVFLTGIVVHSTVHAMVKTARKLGHAVVMTNNGEDSVQLYALPIASGRSQ